MVYSVMEIVRHRELQILKSRLDTNPIVAILGPRQCGKTTLANQFAGQYIHKEVHLFDCEDPRDLARLDNPLLSIEPLDGLIIIDEIQRNPDLFPILRVIVDKFPDKKFLILGSASRDLLTQSSESLAGRISFLELSGFALHDISSDKYNELWIRGNFPRAFLAENQEIAARWREDFIQTFLERDIPNLGLQIPAITLRRFWAMLAHYHSQIFNAVEIGRSLNFSDKTVKRYLDILSGTYKGHHDINDVNRGISPMTPHQLLKYNPSAIIITPAINRSFLSVRPIFSFILFILSVFEN